MTQRHRLRLNRPARRRRVRTRCLCVEVLERRLPLAAEPLTGIESQAFDDEGKGTGVDAGLIDNAIAARGSRALGEAAIDSAPLPDRDATRGPLPPPVAKRNILEPVLIASDPAASDEPVAVDDRFRIMTSPSPSGAAKTGRGAVPLVTKATGFNVLQNDSSAPDTGERLSLAAVTQPQHGGQVSISGDSQSLIYDPADDFIGIETFTYTVQDDRGGSAEAQVTVRSISHWQNPSLATDTNDDGQVSPLDALLGINRLNDRGAVKLSDRDLLLKGKIVYLDGDGDGHHAPLDILLIVNALHRQNRLVAEGEHAAPRGGMVYGPFPATGYQHQAEQQTVRGPSDSYSSAHFPVQHTPTPAVPRTSQLGPPDQSSLADDESLFDAIAIDVALNSR